MWSAARRGLLDRRLRVLDPLCGRGTTLNQVLMNGWHAAGLDMDGRDFDTYSAFLRTWLKSKRLKHDADVTPIRREGVRLGRRLHAEVGATKEDVEGRGRAPLEYVNTDTARHAAVHRPASFDAVVTDAPYGVQHASRTGGPGRCSAQPARPAAEALPVWVDVLRPGGALGISWNTHVARREDAAGAARPRRACEVARRRRVPRLPAPRRPGHPAGRAGGDEAPGLRSRLIPGPAGSALRLVPRFALGLVLGRERIVRRGGVRSFRAHAFDVGHRRAQLPSQLSACLPTSSRTRPAPPNGSGPPPTPRGCPAPAARTAAAGSSPAPTAW